MKIKSKIENLSEKIENLDRQIYFYCNTMKCIGVDNSQNSYWVFIEEKHTLFVA